MVTEETTYVSLGGVVAMRWQGRHRPRTQSTISSPDHSVDRFVCGHISSMYSYLTVPQTMIM